MADRFVRQNPIPYGEIPASSEGVNEDFNDLFTAVNALDSEADDHVDLELDPTDTDTEKEKHLSNAQGKKWEDHVGAITGNPHNVTHAQTSPGSVDETDTNTTKDKHVSNALAKGWEDHKGAVGSHLPGGISSAGTKATPVDADILGYIDTEASNVLKKATWANIKAFLQTYFDSLYQAVSTTILKSLGTTKGDLIVFTGAGAPVRLGVGDDNYVLTADSGEESGVKWAEAAGGGEDPSGATIYGVMATSQTANDGVGLQHIDRYGRVITLTTTDFDAHASFGGDTAFDEYTDGDSNVFCKIPIAYWWRGKINGKWCMLISDQPGTYAGKTFTASPGAFLQDGEWMEQFYIGKYRGHDAGDSKIGSIAGQTHLGSVSFNDWRTRCANVGTGYHLLSLFGWHEILARMVVEKATFQLIPEASRTTAGSCVYRGITDFAYSGTVYAEWMDGIRTDSAGKWELWDEADGTYISSDVACPEYSGSNYYPPSLSASFPYLFLGGGACVAIASAWVPDLNGRSSGYVSRICCSDFCAGNAYDGALRTGFSNGATATNAAIGGRLAKW